MYVILVYDINTDDNGKVLGKIFKLCKKYLSHVQNSVFVGSLTNGELMRLKIDINRYLRNDMDSVIIFKLASQKQVDRELLGLQIDSTSTFL